MVLIEAGDRAAAERICMPALAWSRDVGDLQNQARLLARMAILDLRAGRIDAAAAHLQEELKIATQADGRIDLLNGLDCCGYLCATTRRWAEALTVWGAFAALLRREGSIDMPPDVRHRHEVLREARRALGPALHGRPRNAARP